MKKLILAGAIALGLSTSMALAQDSQGSSPLSGRKGGTNNAFMQFTGPASTIKTFTLPNASDTIATLTGSQTLTNKTLTAPSLGGLVNFTGTFRLSTQSGPSQITSNQNNYNPSSVICATSATLLINSDAARDITGLGGGVAGCALLIVNNGAFTITLKEESGSSTAGNRFKSGGDITVAASQGVTLLYDGAASRWRNTSPATGAGGGSMTNMVVAAGAGIAVSGTCNVTTSGTCTVAQALTNATISGTPTDPTGTTSGSNVMMGLGVSTCRITPVYSGRLRVTIDGAIVNNTTGQVVNAQLRYGTGSGPSNGAGVTGTQASAQSSYGNGGAVYVSGFSKTAIITGLSTGVAVWLDLAMSVTGGTGTASGLTCTAMEF